MQAVQIALGRCGERRFRQKALPRLSVSARYVVPFAAFQRGRAERQSVHAEGLFIEKDFRMETERMIEIRVVIFGIRSDVDAQLFDQAASFFAVSRRTLAPIRTAVA